MFMTVGSEQYTVAASSSDSGERLPLCALGPAEIPTQLSVVTAEAMAEPLGNLILERFVSIEQRTYRNGARHVYGVDEQGKRRHIGHDAILEGYGYQPRSAAYRAGLRANAAQATVMDTPTTAQPELRPLRPPEPTPRVMAAAAPPFRGYPPRRRSWRQRLLNRWDALADRWYDVWERRRETVRTVGTVALLGAVATTGVVIISQLKRTPADDDGGALHGFNPDGTVNCQQVSDPQLYGCPPVHRPKRTATVAPPVTSNPGRQHPTPRKQPATPTLRLGRAGDSIWQEVSQRTKDPATIKRVTSMVLRYNGLSWEQARHLPIGYRAAVPAVAEHVLQHAGR